MSAADLGARARLDAAFAREERRGLMLAAAARSVAVVLIIGWTALVNPERGLAYAWIAVIASFFLVTGIAQFMSYRTRPDPGLLPYVFILVDCLALAAALTRDLDARVVASGALVAAVEREAASAALLEGLKPRGVHVLRGRDTPIDVWAG